MFGGCSANAKAQAFLRGHEATGTATNDLPRLASDQKSSKLGMDRMSCLETSNELTATPAYTPLMGFSTAAFEVRTQQHRRTL